MATAGRTSGATLVPSPHRHPYGCRGPSIRRRLETRTFSGCRKWPLVARTAETKAMSGRESMPRCEVRAGESDRFQQETASLARKPKSNVHLHAKYAFAVGTEGWNL